MGAVLLFVVCFFCLWFEISALQFSMMIDLKTWSL